MGFRLRLSPGLHKTGEHNDGVDGIERNGIIDDEGPMLDASPAGTAPPAFERSDVKLRCSGLGTLLKMTGGSGSGRCLRQAKRPFIMLETRS